MKRTAIVTGANRGLGHETATKLAELGYRVVLTARSQTKADAAATPLIEAGLDVLPRALDVSNEQDIAAFVAWLEASNLEVDVLVNNAGAIFERQGEQWDVGVLEVPAHVISQAVQTNTLGPYQLMLALLPGMNARGFGRIVNVSTGMAGMAEMGGGYPAYRMSKAALNAATRVFADEARGNVKVNAVCPGWVKTDMGGANATRELEDGVSGIVWAATLPDDGPNNGFFRDGKPIPW